MASDFITVKLENRETNIKIEKGCSFENNGAIYRVNEKGLLNIFDKKQKTWSTGTEIKINNYQLQTLMAIANNHDENISKNKNEIVLSKQDITKAIEQHKNSEITKDLGAFLCGNYEIKNAQRYTSLNGVSAYVSNGNENTSANLVFKYGSAESAVTLSNYINKAKNSISNIIKNIETICTPKTTQKTEKKSITNKKPFYDRSTSTTLPEAYEIGLKNVAKKMGISLSKLNQYIVKTAKRTGYSEYFIKHLVALEDYEHKVRNTGDGTITGGFGHSGLKDPNIREGQKVSPQLAFDWLAKDIKYFEKKVKAMKLNPNESDTIGDKFDTLPLSIKEAIIDVAFNRDARKIEQADEYISLRANIKGGYENLPATAVRLCQNFSKYSYEQKKKNKFTTGLMYRNTYRFMLAIRDLNDDYRTIAKRRFENFDSYYTTTVKLKKTKKHYKDVEMLTKTWNQL